MVIIQLESETHDQNCPCCEVLSNILESIGVGLARFEPWKIVLCVSPIMSKFVAAVK